MPSPLRHPLLFLALSLIVAIPLGLFYPWVGGLVVMVSLAAQLCFHLSNLLKLDRWSRAPKMDENLTGKGVWGSIFGRIYRHEKEMYTLLQRRRQEVDMFIAGAEALVDGVLVLDAHFRIAYCNHIAAQQLGLSAHKDRGKPIIDLVRAPEFVRFILAADFSAPFRLLSERHFEAVYTIQIIPYANNRFLMQVKDVTQNERLDKMRRDFVANVSHELRTPLTVLAGFVETVQEVTLSEDDTQRYLSLMSEQAQRMQTIVQDLLTLSTIESAPPPQEQRIDMSDILNKIIAEANALSQGKHRILAEITSASDILGAESEIQSAFSNLVSNAIRYTPEGGKITIFWGDTPDGGARFAVKDSGIGIAAKYLARLTERFYRVDNGRSRAVGGTGLGLSIVKHVSNRHRAQLSIESIPQQGSTFAICFPKECVVA